MFVCIVKSSWLGNAVFDLLTTGISASIYDAWNSVRKIVLHTKEVYLLYTQRTLFII